MPDGDESPELGFGPGVIAGAWPKAWLCIGAEGMPMLPFDIGAGVYGAAASIGVGAGT